jgi:hypothetical protein
MTLDKTFVRSLKLTTDAFCNAGRAAAIASAEMGKMAGSLTLSSLKEMMDRLPEVLPQPPIHTDYAALKRAIASGKIDVVMLAQGDQPFPQKLYGVDIHDIKPGQTWCPICEKPVA